MQAQAPVSNAPREAWLVLAALVLLIAAMAGGYVIRLSTTPSAGPATVTTSTAPGGSSGISSGNCIYVQAHRGC